MQRKKSRFWLFIFSFIPGAGEMYMGFMKMGLSLMLVFLSASAVAGYTNMGVLAVVPVVLYFYSFFHANNLRSLDDMTFHNIEDRYLFGLDGVENKNMRLEGRNRKVAAVILIILGAMMLWQVVFNLLCDIFGWDNRFLSAVYYFVRDELPRAIVGIGVIWVGLALIRGRSTGDDAEGNDDGLAGYVEQDIYGQAYTGSNQSVYGTQHMENGQSAYGTRHMENGQSAYGRQHVENDQSAYGRQHVENDQSAYGRQHVENGQSAYGTQHVENGQSVYGMQYAENGQGINDRPADVHSADREPSSPSVNGNVIYAGGPVAEAPNVNEHTNYREE